jgi:hypothetical protein
MKFIRLFENFNSEDIEDLFLHLIDDHACVKEKNNTYLSVFRMSYHRDFEKMKSKLDGKKIEYFTISTNIESYRIYIPNPEVISFFLSKTEKSEKVRSEQYIDIVTWKENGKIIAEFNELNRSFNIVYFNFWEVFEDKYGMSRIDTELFMEFMLSRYFNIYNLGRIRPI